MGDLRALMVAEAGDRMLKAARDLAFGTVTATLVMRDGKPVRIEVSRSESASVEDVTGSAGGPRGTSSHGQR